MSPYTAPSAWSPSSWRTKPIAQTVEYPDPAALESTLSQLRVLPPLVTPTEVERLLVQLASVQRGEAFLLQGGDCAEAFAYANARDIESKLKLMLLMSLVIVWGARTPVVRVLRGAGQYAKPRSKPTEVVDGVEIPSYRGDIINSPSPAASSRTPDPARLLQAYFYSTSTLNYLRALLASSFADVHAPRAWSFAHVRDPDLQQEFEDVVDDLADAMDFMRVLGAEEEGREGKKAGTEGVLGTVDLFTSHEGLLLEYESALTRHLPIPSFALPTAAPSPPPCTSTPPAPSRASSRARTPLVADAHAADQPKAWYNTSAAFIWIGDRTRQLDGAHVEYFSGIRNPIGVKVGPSMSGEELSRILEILDPHKIPGKITLITRYGADKIDKYLPAHIRAASHHPCIWQCDPMHGNTLPSPSNPSIKTRRFADVVLELTRCISIHAELGLTRLGGVHLEMTGEVDENGFSVTECLGGSMRLDEGELGRRYQTFCDPRLNLEQSLDVAFLISKVLKRQRRGESMPEELLEALRGRSEARKVG